MKFGKWISTKDLYLVTLQQLVNVEYDDRTSKTTYIMPKRYIHRICRRKNDKYYDIFTETLYQPIHKTEQGSYGISKSTPLMYNKKFVSLEELSNKFAETNEQLSKKDKYNNPKTKKIIPFPKKY